VAGSGGEIGVVVTVGGEGARRLSSPMTTNRGRESQARGGPPPPDVRAKGWIHSPGGRGEDRRAVWPRGASSRGRSGRPDHSGRDERGERTGRDPNIGPETSRRIALPGRDPYVLSSTETNDPSGRLRPATTRGKRQAQAYPTNTDGSLTLCRVGGKKSAGAGGGRRSGRGPRNARDRGRRSGALTLSAHRAAGLITSTIQQFCASPTRNSGTTNFLRKAGLSGPT